MNYKTEKIKKIWQLICRFFRSIGNFYAISHREAGYILLMFVIMLGINYLLIAINGFSLSYAKQWPPISCIKDVFWLLLLLINGHFICRRGRWYLLSVASLQFIFLFILLAIYFTTGTFFCEAALYLVYDTTWEETKGFFETYVSLKSILIIIGIILTYAAGSYFIMKMYKPEKKYCRGDFMAILTLAVILLFPTVKIVKNGHWNVLKVMFLSHPLNAIYNHIRIFNAHSMEFIVEIRHRTPPDYVALKQNLEKNPPIGVLVIGESAIRDHHSIYGYSRNTTPNMLKRKDSIIAFDDTIAVLPMTIVALKYWLTDTTLENRHISWTIFDALKVAGYKTDVITNQNKSGWADSPLQMIFKTADSVTYMHEENYSDLADDRNAGIYDALVLPPFAKWVDAAPRNSIPQLAVVHLFGSHEPFSSRYPSDFSKTFLNDKNYTQLVNEYDTSILYSDMILEEMISKLEKMDRPAFLIYISDHGSVCKSDSLRTPASENNSAYEVPFFIWINQNYRETLPHTVQRMQKRRSVPLQADRAHFGMLEMMGIRFTKDVSRQNFLSDNFIELPRYIQEGKVLYVRKEDIK